MEAPVQPEPQKRRRKLDGRPHATGRAWGFGIFSLIAILLGVLFSELALVEIGVLGVLILVVARMFARWNFAELRVARVVPDFTFAHQDFSLELNVVNDKPRMESFGVEVEDKLLPTQERGLALPSIRSGESRRGAFYTRIVRRGVKREMRYIVRSRFPLGLFEIGEQRKWRRDITVFPRPVIPDALRNYLELEMHEEGSEATFKQDWEGDFRSVREFRAGDPLKFMHWPSVAKTQRLMIREYDRPLPQQYTLLYHAWAAPGQLIWPEAFEHAMELLAGLMVYCRSQHIPLSLSGVFNSWKPMDIRGMHDLTEPLTVLAKARYRGEKNFDALLDALNDLPGSHPVFVVSATPLDQWEDKLPPSAHRVICLDNTGMRVRPVKPRLRYEEMKKSTKRPVMS